MATEQKIAPITTTDGPGSHNGAARRVKRRKPVPKWVIAVVVLAVVGLGWFLWARTHPAQDGTAGMITGKVTRGTLVESVTATGSVTAQTGAEVAIGSQITGVIKRLYADVGSHVKKNQVIAVLDLPDLKANVDQAQANLVAAQAKLQQTVSGVPMTETQIKEALSQAQAGEASAQAKVVDAQATAQQTVAQTPTDVRRAQTALASAKAALDTAKATLVQTQTGANLQIANAKEAVTQAQANATNSNLNLQRQQALLAKGFVAQSVVDQAQATATVNQSLVGAAQENLTLTQQKVTADLATARDGVAQAQQNVQSAQAALAAAQSEYYTNKARIADVASAKAAQAQAAQGVQTAVANLAQIGQQQQIVDQAKAAVQQAQAQLTYNQVQLDKSYIRSPIDGTVLQLAEQQGETIAAGLSAPTLIVVADLNRLQIDAFVDETDVSSVKIGQTAQVVVDAFPKHTFQGTVSKIASGSTIQNGVVTYDVTISIKQDRKHQLKPDMTATVTIQTGERDNVLLVPSVAVQMGTHSSTVNVIETKNGRTNVVPVKVKTGGTDGVNTEIDGGLTEGQTIVVAGAPSGGRGFGPANPFQQRSGGGGGGHGGGGRGGG